MSVVNTVKPKITVLPATKNRFTAIPLNSLQKRRVAAYARVSTDSDEQFTSYEAQIDYYTKYIQAREDWEFVKVYTDEGISALSTKHRHGFNDMIQDALAGKIDLIITKSVSRFARNTVDSLLNVRELKEHGVEIFFEKENIWTLDSKGELLITIMSSLAQEESRSISENVTWGQRKRFADGKVSMPYKRFLGYEKGPDGIPIVNEAEAATVRLIYRLFLEGRTPSGVGSILERMGVPSPSGKGKWSQTTIISILTNEKYKGDAVLQKKFTVDYIKKKMKVNEGEVPQYYVHNSHEAIISPMEFDLVQAEFARRKQMGRSYSGNDLFASRLYCGDCGSLYGQKVWHSNDPYRRTVHHCNGKFKGEQTCTTPTLSAEEIQSRFLLAYNQMMGERDTVIEDCELMRAALTKGERTEQQIQSITEEIEIIAGLVQLCVNENATNALPQQEYSQKYNSLVNRYERASAKLTELKAERAKIEERDRKIQFFIEMLKTQPLILDKWDAQLWNVLLEKATVFRDGSILFEFKNNYTVTIDPKAGAA